MRTGGENHEGGPLWLEGFKGAGDTGWRLLVAIVGFGCLRAWLGWMLGALRDTLPPELFVAGMSGKLVFDMGELLGAVVGVLLVYKLRSLCQSRPVLLSSALFALLGTVVLGSGVVPDGAFALVCLFVAFLCGMGYLIVVLAWTELLGVETPARVMGVAIGSYFLSSVVWFYMRGMAAPTAAATGCLLMGVACVLFARYYALLPSDLPRLVRPAKVWSFGRVYVWVWAFALAYGIGASFTNLGYATAAAKVGTMLPLLLIGVPYVLGRGRFDFSLVYRLSFLVMIGGFLIAFVTNGNAALMQALFSASQAMVMAIALTFSCGVARLGRMSAAAPYGVISVGWYVSAIPARYLSSWIQETLELSAVQDLLLMSAAIVLLAVAALFCFREVDFVERWKAICADLGNGDLVEACNRLAEAGGLTKRETSILTLLIQGASQADISEQLFIAPGTVRAHVNHIYGKLGVHSGEELRERYEEALG